MPRTPRAEARVDVVPPGCSVHVDVNLHDDTVRFQARDADGRLSLWSGWFPMPGEDDPIRLTWAAFDFGD